MYPIFLLSLIFTLYQESNFESWINLVFLEIFAITFDWKDGFSKILVERSDVIISESSLDIFEKFCDQLLSLVWRGVDFVFLE